MAGSSNRESCFLKEKTASNGKPYWSGFHPKLGKVTIFPISETKSGNTAVLEFSKNRRSRGMSSYNNRASW